MKKVLTLGLFFCCVLPIFAQQGSENLSVIEELKDSKLYIYMKDRNPNQNRFILTRLKNGTYNILLIIGPNANIYAYKSEKPGSSSYPRFNLDDLSNLIKNVGN